LQKFGICSGATITGDGRAMLFLNIPELIRYKAVNS
jgi:chemotaxis protein histidine kinase CheA